MLYCICPHTLILPRRFNFSLRRFQQHCDGSTLIKTRIMSSSLLTRVNPYSLQITLMTSHLIELNFVTFDLTDIFAEHCKGLLVVLISSGVVY